MIHIKVDPASAARMYEELQRVADRATAAVRPPQHWAAFEDLAEYAPGVYTATNDPRLPAEFPKLLRAFYKEL